jgi:hypothetical protein
MKFAQFSKEQGFSLYLKKSEAGLLSSAVLRNFPLFI